MATQPVGTCHALVAVHAGDADEGNTSYAEEGESVTDDRLSFNLRLQRLPQSHGQQFGQGETVVAVAGKYGS